MSTFVCTGTPSMLVAAPPSLHRQGLLATLRDQWPTLACTITPDTTQLLPLLRQQSYSLVVLDSELSGPPLPLLLGQLRRIRSCQPVLVLTGRRLAAGIRQHLLQAGAGALLCHHVAPAAVLATVAALLRGTAGGTHTSPLPARHTAPPTPFSAREVEVLRLVVADCCNQEIADRLFLSVRTVESHRRTLLQKTGAKTLIGLVVQAVREGWVPVA
ncbi:helix-turn-helix transcriptional regulator [Hymenobacter puniceus]|uniref:helix-turn-helix transcriptional regulator n=1 Tax=Hymenobacter sp. BT190 TaxID=2763505 RepID=UPI00165112AE|nr:LuxR C-terminal-related transcriptional regulator [Hymenobacter sp. BT190]MBC6700409.1 response regulator transcription factor [Hymenobacter sp. BT190]